MGKKYYYCHNCEQGTEAEEKTGKPVFCRHCGRLINLNELKEMAKPVKKKTSTRKKKE